MCSNSVAVGSPLSNAMTASLMTDCRVLDDGMEKAPRVMSWIAAQSNTFAESTVARPPPALRFLPDNVAASRLRHLRGWVSGGGADSEGGRA